MKIYVSVPQGKIVDTTFFTESARSYLEQHFEVAYSPLDRHPTAEELRQLAADADVLMIGWGHPMVDAAMLAGTNIKILAHTGGSVADYADASLYRAGIRVISGNELYAESVAEGTLAYILMALRRLPEAADEVRSGGWALPFFTEGLLDQTVGIIGMGAISRKLIKLLQLFRVKLKLYSSHAIDAAYLQANNAEQASLEDIFSTCKLVSLHSALNESTQGMITKAHFDLLQDGAIFLNTARGAIIREEDLIEALKENRFRAVLDVYCREPLAQDSPLRSLPNVYPIPHKAGPTDDRRPIVVMALADDILRFFRGEQLRYEISARQALRMTKERKA